MAELKPNIKTGTPDFSLKGKRNELFKKGAADPIEYSPEEIKKLLKNCLLIPPEFYSKLNNGDRIYYHKTDGNFSTGGIFEMQWQKNNEKFIKIRFNKKSKEGYVVKVDNIQKLYKRIPKECQLEIYLIKKDILKLEKAMKKLALKNQLSEASEVSSESST